MGALTGKVALITGASSGIGYAAARLFAFEGAELVVTGRRGDALDALLDEIKADGGVAVALAGDLRDDGLPARLVERAIGTFGGLDIALNNAGMLGEMAPVAEISLAGWRETIEINLTSAFACAQSQVPAMLARGGGSLVFTSTFVGPLLGFPGMAAYAAAKAGLVGLARVIAVEYGVQKIRANALLVGGTDTPMGRDVTNTPEALAFVESLHALKRIADPREIAQAALFLASDASSFVTGSAMSVDGGVSMTRT
ncbi:MAG: SDR family oxidoreductase [Parvibaculum sp.]|nr:SDR family oxidoreductase [Parvibaculum sp.]|tara:strand:- start:3365 stop:4129 length:765 start_codon:yes stop_codon:yes gene_type:complete